MRNPFEKINLSKETKYFLYGFGAASAFLTLGGILKIVKKARAKKSSPKHVKAKHVKQRTVKVAGLEIGGTSCLVAIGEKTIDDSGNILDIRFVDERKKLRVDTTNPKETLGAMMSFIKNEIFEEIGIASFGPLCLDENKDSYGHIMKTPKKKWVNFDILSFVKERIPLSAGVPALDTDVNAPALLEYLKGKNSPQAPSRAFINNHR